LVHALRESIEPTLHAFATEWPEASTFNVLDDSLSAAVSVGGSANEHIDRRLLKLAHYAAAHGGDGRAVDGMLITSSAFTNAISAAKDALGIPVMGPYEAAFKFAVERARRVGLLVTFEASEYALTVELQRVARARAIDLEVVASHVPGALAALQNGNVAEHNARISAAAQQLHDCELIILGQFSMAQAASSMSADLRAKVLTTLACAVSGMRSAIAARGIE
jgi:Asp/Glu/hydantoin racemase